MIPMDFRVVKGHPKTPRGVTVFLRKRSGSWQLGETQRQSTLLVMNLQDWETMLGIRKNSGKKTHPVGLKEANPYELYDVHGNVWEWVQDNDSKSLSGGIDPLHTSSGSHRIIRGGGWGNSA